MLSSHHLSSLPLQLVMDFVNMGLVLQPLKNVLVLLAGLVKHVRMELHYHVHNVIARILSDAGLIIAVFVKKVSVVNFVMCQKSV